MNLAKALRVSTDELLGLPSPRRTASSKTARRFNSLRWVEELPTADQEAVLKFMAALLESRSRSKTQRAAGSRI